MTLFKLEMLSQYRSPIMGVAMIWVVLYHYQLQGALRHLFMVGFTGVDLFMFVSGLGLYYSMYNDNDVKNFYVKRFLRIFPIYYLIGLILDLLAGDFNPFVYLYRYSTIGFWINGVYGNGWFVPSIITLYLLYPFFYRTFFVTRIDWFALSVTNILIFSFIFYICLVDHSLLDINHYLLLYRIPIFLFGSIIGCFIKKKNKIDIINRNFLRVSVLLLPLFFLIFLLDHKTAWGIYLSTTFVGPFILIVLCCVFNKIRVLSVIMGGVGNASLEIFMIQAIPLMYFNKYSPVFQYHDIIMIGVCSIVVLLGIGVHYFYEGLTNLIKNHLIVRL